MDFIYGDSVALGVCTNLSDSGLRGAFSQYVPSGAEGLLTLYHGDQRVVVQAQFYAGNGEEARVQFRFQSDQERAAIGDLLKILAAGSQR